MFDPKTKTILGCDGMKWSYIENRISGNPTYTTCDEIQKKGASVFAVCGAYTGGSSTLDRCCCYDFINY